MTSLSKKLLGIHLIVAALLTWIWEAVCPQITIEGNSWLALKIQENGGWHTQTNYFIRDPIVFATGAIVIWGTILGLYFLINGYSIALTSESKKEADRDQLQRNHF